MKRIKREFRQIKSPAKFFAFITKVRYALAHLSNCPASLLPLLQLYFEKVDSYETIYHTSLDGSHSMIRDRDKLGQEIMVLLDQIASGLESAFMLDPDALLNTGFTITQERRSTRREKQPLAAPQDFSVANTAEIGQALAKAIGSPGALVHEIHINQKDPSVEEDWFHKGIFPDCQNMVMEHLAAGNTFFRTRDQGPDGAGPWSAIVSTTIT